jgi:hypothetical protein
MPGRLSLLFGKLDVRRVERQRQINSELAEDAIGGPSA